MSVMGLRRIFFQSDKFTKKKSVLALQEEHKKAFGNPINDLAYPDMGCGRYSDELPYSEWVQFNNAQRGHYNMVESSAPVLTLVAVGGLFYPRLCSALGVVYAIGMMIFSLGYRSNKGSDGRMAGAVLRSVSTLLLSGVGLAMGLKAAGFNIPF